MLTMIKLDFIYDLNPMKMRIDDLEAVYSIRKTEI